MMRRLLIVAASVLALFISAPSARAQIDTETPTQTATETATETPTEVPTDTATATATDTVAETPTDTPAVAPTDTPTDTPVVAPTDTPVVGATDTPIDTPTDTPAAGPTDTPTQIPTDTPVGGPTDTPTDTPVVPAATPTDTPVVPADTPTDTPVVPADTPTDTPSPLATATATATPPPTITFTPTVISLKGSSFTKRSIVQAQCAGAVSCNSAGITFAKGKVRIQLVKPPNAVGERVVGKIKMTRVFPVQPLLQARVIGDITYGSDPDGDCPLANTQAAAAIYATSTMSCVAKKGASNCKGIVALPALFPAACTDVSVLVNNAHILVYDIAAPGTDSSLIGRDGIKIRARR